MMKLKNMQLQLENGEIPDNSLDLKPLTTKSIIPQFKNSIDQRKLSVQNSQNQQNISDVFQNHQKIPRNSVSHAKICRKPPRLQNQRFSNLLNHSAEDLTPNFGKVF